MKYYLIWGFTVQMSTIGKHAIMNVSTISWCVMSCQVYRVWTSFWWFWGILSLLHDMGGHPSVTSIPSISQSMPPHPLGPLLTSPTQEKSFASLFSSKETINYVEQALIPFSNHHGEPALKLSNEMANSFAKPFKFTLIGKFRRQFDNGGCKDSLHKIRTKGPFLFRPSWFEAHVDQSISWSKLQLDLDEGARVYRLFFNESFQVVTGVSPSSIVLVWVSLLSLPLFMFNKPCLFSNGNINGSPMTCDLPTAKISRPSVARLWVKSIFSIKFLQESG